MIRSRINTYGFWVGPVMLLIISGFSILVLYFGEDRKDIIPVLSLWIFFIVLLAAPLLYSILITIDPSEKTINITRFFTRQKIIYKFSDFDGYVTMMVTPARGRPYEVLYLVKNEKFILKISSIVYSNFNDLKNELKGLKYLGNLKFSYGTMLKIFLKQNVLNN